jgi:hypothetical protein
MAHYFLVCLPYFAGLEALVKAKICVPACRQAGTWQIFITKFPENICGYTVALKGGVDSVSLKETEDEVVFGLRSIAV